MKPAFAMTINKSQGIFKHFLSFTFYCVAGQTLKNVGIWLRSPVFTHGQLYVACSRVGRPTSLKFAIRKKSDGVDEPVPNIVFKEVLTGN